mmetsp:Transcript_38909/g.39320  ORF Transcript_38909/g.39320 Transcript_38909/m.39320 type:complete len:113 (-) Transcript_38909:470-808(-)
MLLASFFVACALTTEIRHLSITNLVLPTMFPHQTSLIACRDKNSNAKSYNTEKGTATTAGTNNSNWKNNKSKTRVLRILLIVMIHHLPISDPKMIMVLHHHRHHLRHLLLHL